MDAELNSPDYPNVCAARKQIPEDLNELRTIVEAWLRRARKAVWTFAKEDGAFQRDSQTPDRSSFTTTARCYMALATVERQLPTTHHHRQRRWQDQWSDYIKSLQVRLHGPHFQVTLLNGTNTKHESECLNNFEVAHFADLEFVHQFCSRFDTNISASTYEKLTVTADECADFQTTFEFLDAKLHQCNADDVEIPFDDKSDFSRHSSRHYFVTLHILRAIHILSDQKANGISYPSEAAISTARLFCIEQCFYFQRHVKHKQDPARLVFASLLYCMYARDVDREVMVATVEAIAGIQEHSGKWPASHPVVMGERKERKQLWYIASAELGLCLTWLYFQPKLPDPARNVVLSILESHFRNWIIPTYTTARGQSDTETSTRVFSGWSDDSAIGQNKVVGWTTAIVCHFLANYHSVLNDHINRAVIESLNLREVAERYLVDASAPNRNPRWTTKTDTDTGTICWPDLPPIAWPAPTDTAAVAMRIQKCWTDPEVDAALSNRIADQVLLPILSVPTNRPARDMVAGILDGPPGTRKTSLVTLISEILQWPYIPVPASAIFSRGFDYMEAQSSTVFRRLTYLTQCVIFFDEFEEFFRSRREDHERLENTRNFNANGISSHNRTIAAFTTSAMLPRLQALHDGRRSLVFLATNHFEGIDDAVVRAGRFDFKEVVNHPKIARFDESQGYFYTPTTRTLESLRLDVDADLKVVAEAVARALEARSTKCLLRNLPENADVAEKDDTSLRIRFSIVETVAGEVANAIRTQRAHSTDPADAILEMESLMGKALFALEENIEKVTDQKKGPGPLSPPQ